MNKSNTKKNKVDKCPSTFTQENKDVDKKCFITEKISEHKNGVVNGIMHKSEMYKKPRKNKKCKEINSENRESFNNEFSEFTTSKTEVISCSESSPELNALDQSNNLQENYTCKSDIVNKVDKPIKTSKKKSNKLKKLDSNENISSNDLCEKLSLVTSCNKREKSILQQDVQQTNISLNEVLKESVASSSKIFDGVDIDSSQKEELEIVNSLQNLQINECEKYESLAPELENRPKIDFVQYESELQMPMIMKIIQKDLSEPYSIYTYRYFIHNWPKLCFLAMCEDQCVGAIVCKLDMHRKVIRRGYIAMLAVDQQYRKLHIGSTLVQMAINEMILGDADEVVLETEVTNKPALQLYEKLGFVRDKRLFRYYLNGVDALRLKLWLR